MRIRREFQSLSLDLPKLIISHDTYMRLMATYGQDIDYIEVTSDTIQLMGMEMTVDHKEYKYAK